MSAALAARSITVDEAAVERCRRAAAERYQGCDWVTPALPSLPRECQGLVRGTLADGSVCRSSLECAKSSHCAGLSPSKAGRCAPPRAVGAACGAHVDAMASYVLERDVERSHPFCADFCSLTTHRCAPLPSEGATCFADVNCAPDQRCKAGRCSADVTPPSARAHPGEPCSTDFDCAMGGCAPRDDGTKECGMKCVASLDALAHPSKKAMKLPLRP